jgi:hypothetical protein
VDYRIDSQDEGYSFEGIICETFKTPWDVYKKKYLNFKNIFEANRYLVIMQNLENRFSLASPELSKFEQEFMQKISNPFIQDMKLDYYSKELSVISDYSLSIYNDKIYDIHDFKDYLTLVSDDLVCMYLKKINVRKRGYFKVEKWMRFDVDAFGSTHSTEFCISSKVISKDEIFII